MGGNLQGAILAVDVSSPIALVPVAEMEWRESILITAIKHNPFRSSCTSLEETTGITKDLENLLDVNVMLIAEG